MKSKVDVNLAVVERERERERERELYFSEIRDSFLTYSISKLYVYLKRKLDILIGKIVIELKV